jgi:predicted lipoprotein with Yx(FWY)xxD motif
MVDGKSQTILVDAAGLTLYYFTPDKGGKVTCTAGCLAVWPPLLLPSGVTTPTGGTGVTGTLATIANPDGKGTQIMYNNWPLYFYAKDKSPGDTTGQNVNQKWFVVPPDLAKG